MTPAYELQDLKYHYNGTLILNINRFSINAGQTVAVVGPNGSGKSTMLNLLAFVSAQSEGQIKFFGEVENEKSRHDFRRRIGYVQQNPYLFNSTVIENVEIALKLRSVGKKLRHNRAINILEQLKLHALGNRRAHELSAGEVQKVALARALILEPEVLIMDEPFTYLDKSFISEFENMLIAIRDNRLQTIIFTSHDHMRAQILADQVCSIINGKLILESSINLFHGIYSMEKRNFDTGRINIKVSENSESGDMIAIEPTQIVLSRTELDSSMRNRFKGEIKALHARGDHIQITVDVGERFQAIITKEALDDLGMNLGDTIWLSFKSSAVKVL